MLGVGWFLLQFVRYDFIFKVKFAFFVDKREDLQNISLSIYPYLLVDLFGENGSGE